MQNICRWTALTICGVLAVLTVLLVVPGVFRIHPLIVQSGSMEPVYPMGSLVYVRGVEPEDLKKGQTVTFYLPDNETLVTHRIVDTDKVNKAIYTKGDANDLEDGVATPFSRIVGRPIFCIPGLGYLAGYLSNPAGKAGILMLVILVCILSWMEGAVQKRGKEFGHEDA